MWTCMKCKETHDESFEACWNCGTQQFQDQLERANVSESKTHTFSQTIPIVGRPLDGKERQIKGSCEVVMFQWG